MRKNVVRDAQGQVINIGPWDFCLVKDRETGRDRITNPFPAGATQAEEEVLVRADGGLAAADDHKSLRSVEYPPLAEQLDALWKGGADLDAMRERILGIKAKYPKVAR